MIERRRPRKINENYLWCFLSCCYPERLGDVVYGEYAVGLLMGLQMVIMQLYQDARRGGCTRLYVDLTFLPAASSLSIKCLLRYLSEDHDREK